MRRNVVDADNGRRNKKCGIQLSRKRRFYLLTAAFLAISSYFFTDIDPNYPNTYDKADNGYQTHRRGSVATKMVRSMVRSNRYSPKILHSFLRERGTASGEVGFMEDGLLLQSSKESKIRSEHNKIRNNIENKPIMNTFFHRIPKQERITGMSDDSDSEMIKIWEDSWQSSGWKTRVLTLEDAQKHPDFEKFEKELEGVWLGKKPQYDKMCYYRWLAMSAVGGGWMSDYDLLPLPGSSFRKKTNTTSLDRFIVHDQTLRGDAIPSLLSGNKKEWDRMAHLLLENAIGHKHDKSLPWTDMRALIEIYDKEAKVHPYDMIDEVILGHLIIPEPNSNLSQSECATIQKLKGVHVCHHAMKTLGLKPEDRPQIANQFMKEWKEVCDDGDIEKNTAL